MLNLTFYNMNYYSSFNYHHLTWCKHVYKIWLTKNIFKQYSNDAIYMMKCIQIRLLSCPRKVGRCFWGYLLLTWMDTTLKNFKRKAQEHAFVAFFWQGWTTMRLEKENVLRTNINKRATVFLRRKLIIID